MNKATCTIKLLSFLCVLASHGASRRALEPQWRLPPCFPPGARLGNLWEASGKPQGSLWGAGSPWGASGEPLGASGDPLGNWEPLGNLWGASSERLWNLQGTSGKLLGSLLGAPVVWGLWKALQLGKVCLCNGLHWIN